MFNYFDLNKRAGKALSQSVEEYSKGESMEAAMNQSASMGKLPSLSEHYYEKGKSSAFDLEIKEALEEISRSQREIVKIQSTPPTIPPLKPMTRWHQIIIYSGIFVGILFSPVIDQWKAGIPINFDINLGFGILALFLAFFIFPNVYEKLCINPKAPLLVQFGLSIQNGVFWQVILTAIGKTIAG